MLRSPQLSSSCLACTVPFRGPLGFITRLRGVRRSETNPHLCNRCESHLVIGQLHPVTIVSLSFHKGLGFGRISLQSLSDREMPAIRNRLAQLFEQFGGLVLPINSSPKGILQICFNAPVRLEDPVTSAFDSVKSAVAWIYDEESALGISLPIKVAIANGFVEVFGESGHTPLCPIGQVTLRSPELLRFALDGQVVADSIVASELGFTVSQSSNVIVIYDRLKDQDLPRHSFIQKPSWNFTFLGQVIGLLMALLSIPCAVMLVAAPSAAFLGLAALIGSVLPLWNVIGMSFWLRIFVTLVAVFFATINLIRVELSMRRFRLLQASLGYSFHLPPSQRLNLRIVRFTSYSVLFLVALEGILRVFVMKMSLL